MHITKIGTPTIITKKFSMNFYTHNPTTNSQLNTPFFTHTQAADMHLLPVCGWGREELALENDWNANGS
jgi:hypothetical protein